MFCDLVGSTSLAAKLDAEDWRNLVNAYLDEASAAVTDFGGHVLKKLGDGLMALFGYPQAQENDAERAVRAALAIQRALSDLNARNAAKGAPELSARIGIESGPVVVEASGEVFGDAPNIAARVQAAAEPGPSSSPGSVQRQMAGLFVAEEQGRARAQGRRLSRVALSIVRASGGGRRGGARALTSFVGREEDIGTLLRRWDRVRAGEGQFVLIVGEPGLGKSRLDRRVPCATRRDATHLGEWSVVAAIAEHAAASSRGMGAAALWRQDAARRTAPRRPREHATAGRPRRPANMRPCSRRWSTFRCPRSAPRNSRPKSCGGGNSRRWRPGFWRGRRAQPVVLAFEDLHWADPTSLDLIQALAERGAQAPLLVVATTRPEFRAPWGMRSHHAVVALAPLDRTEVRRMVGEIAAQHALPQDVVERVSERTGGVPLFVEEVTRLLVERGEQGGVQAIPPTLQQSLAARLDRLGPAREVAQIGAVLGRDFVYALLRDVAEIDEPALQASLERLADADLLFVEGAPPEAKYRFKHALIQDAAYDSLLKSRRQALHRRAAEVLRDANAEPEAIAHHFTEAGLDDLAIEWWGKAGDQALRRSAFQEAIAHLGKAIEMADRAGTTARSAPGGSAASNRRLTQLHVARANALGLRAVLEPRKRRKPSPEPTNRLIATRTRPNDRRRTLGYGPAATCEESCRRCGRTQRPSSATSRRDPILPRPASPIAPPGSLAGSPANIARRGIAWKGRLPCSNPAATTIWPIASDGTPASLRWPIWRLPRGLSARSIARSHSLIACKTRAAGLTHVGTLAAGKLYAAMFELMRGDHLRATPERFRIGSPRARTRDGGYVSRVRRCISRVGRPLQSARAAVGSRTCAAASSSSVNRTFCFLTVY